MPDKSSCPEKIDTGLKGLESITVNDDTPEEEKTAWWHSQIQLERTAKIAVLSEDLLQAMDAGGFTRQATTEAIKRLKETKEPKALSLASLLEKIVANQVVVFTVPPGVRAGQQIVVQAPNGQRVTVQLPPNTVTGQRMQVNVSDEAAAPAAKKKKKKKARPKKKKTKRRRKRSQAKARRRSRSK